MSRIVLLMIIMLSGVAFSEPKEYQNILINEPVSLMDLMIYKNRLRLNSKESDKYYIDQSDPAWSLMKSFSKFHDGFPFRDFEWDIPFGAYQLSFIPPLTVGDRDISFLFSEGLFEINLDMRWEMNTFIFTSMENQTGELKASQKNMAKLCQIQLQRLSNFGLLPYGHEGYTNGSMGKVEKEMFFNLARDTRYKVKIHAFGDWYNEERYTYLTCTTNKKFLKPVELDKVTYEFIGKWHELDAEVKRQQNSVEMELNK